MSVSGLYGVLTYTFGQRTREIGIRIALGASARAISRLVFDYSLRLGGVGLLIGLVAGFVVMKVLSTFVRLDNVSVLDPAAFVLSVVVIALALGTASVGPARRAARPARQRCFATTRDRRTSTLSLAMDSSGIELLEVGRLPLTMFES